MHPERTRTKNYEITETGLILHDNITLEEWEDLGVHLGVIHNASRWCIGDWLVYGEGRGDWGESYAQGIEATNLDYYYLSTLARVARAFPYHTRRHWISISHHIATLALPPDEREQALDLADRKDMTRDELRAYVRERRASLGLLPAPKTRKKSDEAAGRIVRIARTEASAQSWKAYLMIEIDLQDLPDEWREGTPIRIVSNG